MLTVAPRNMRRQLGPWRVLELGADGRFVVLSEHGTRAEAIAEELRLRQAVRS